DLIIFGKDSVGVDLLKLQLKMKFEMKDMGELQYFLGIQVLRDRKNKMLQILQLGYINMILERFGMQNSTPVATPIATGTKLVRSTEESTVNQKQYQSNVGSQMYAMLCTRPDLAYAISQISQFSSNPSIIHESAAKRVLKYLNGTRNFGITLMGSVDWSWRDTAMQTGEQGRTESRSLDTFSLSQAAQSHGPRRSRPRRHYQQRKRNISP